MEDNSEFSNGFFVSMITVLCVCVFGMVGNVLSAITLLQKEMRSSTTYLLVGLTFSDFLLLVLSFLRTFNNLHPLNLNSSEILSTFIFLWDWTCTGGTKYYTIAISLERYIVVCHPFKGIRWINDRRAKLYTLSVFIFNVILALGSYFYSHYLHSFGFEVYAAIVLHFTPFLIVLVFNALIYLGIRDFKKSRKELTSTDASVVSVTRMLLCVVLVFGICYSFEFTRRILNYAGYFDYENYQYYDYKINHLADFFYVLNSSVNFIIYILMGTKFRNQFIKLVKATYHFITCKKQRNDRNPSTANAKTKYVEDDTISSSI